MERPTNRLACILILAALLAWQIDVSAQSVDDGLLPSAAAAATGGSHVAAATGFDALFANPAGLAGTAPQFSVAELSVRSTGPVFTLAGLVMRSLAGEDAIALLGSPDVQRLLSALYARATVTGPLAFGYVGGGMGFGVYNVTDMTVQSVPGGIETIVGERILLRGGYGLSVPIPLESSGAPGSWGTASVGLGVKGFVRGDVTVATTLLGLPTFLESIGPDLVADSPFSLISGFGVDLGLRYAFPFPVTIGLTVEDLYTPTAATAYSSFPGFLDGDSATAATVYALLPQRINLGVLWSPRLGVIERYVGDLRLMMDYRDIFGVLIAPADSRNLVLLFGLGAEATLLDVLSVRVGFSEGLFAAGLGLDLTHVRLSAAMFGSELSSEPGLRPQYNLAIGLEFRR